MLNRGVEKRDVVLDDKDRVRFIHDLFVFNDRKAALHMAQPERARIARHRELLVHIHAFCLMPNHYHLLLSPVFQDGISLFMKKLNMGYAKYFNEKYGRAGALWQGKYKKVHIERDAHFMYIPYYIHLNPLDLSLPQWRSGKVSDPRAALKALRAYRWSSFLDYQGQQNFPSLIWQKELGVTLGSPQRQEKEITAIIKNSDIAQNSFVIEP